MVALDEGESVAARQAEAIPGGAVRCRALAHDGHDTERTLGEQREVEGTAAILGLG